MKIAINGNFMSARITGIERYGRGITEAIDKLIGADDEVILLLPPNAQNVPTYQNIETLTIGKHTRTRWEQQDFAKWLRKHKNFLPLNYNNVRPVFAQDGITVIHDVMYRMKPSEFCVIAQKKGEVEKLYLKTKSRLFRNFLVRKWHRYQYRLIARKELKIITVSQYSINDITKYYPKAKGKVICAPPAWQHVLEYRGSEDWQERFPFLKTGEFYFSLATVARNKNGRWIIEAAKYNPQAQFAIGGSLFNAINQDEVPENVHLLGYVTDEDACSLIKNCKAFLFPSSYEGFGLPPLEALGLGATVISSNATSLPEVLGNSAHYIEPDNPNVDLDELLREPIAPPEDALERFSFEKSAQIIISAVRGLQK